MLFRRHLTTTLRRYKVIFETPQNEEIVVFAKENMNLLDLAHENEIDLEGACEGSLACSTCIA
jgi:ferredoxin